MATILRGKSICGLCHQVITEGQEIVSLPAFVYYQHDPAAEFNDAVFHKSCFSQLPVVNYLLQRIAEFYDKTSPTHRFCEVCRQKILSPDDYIDFGYLIADEDNPLYQYNYAQFHRSHLSQWIALAVVYQQLKEMQKSGVLKGETLERLLSEMNQAYLVSLSGKG